MANSPKRMPISKASSDAIRKAREAKGWSQSQLAAKAKVPRARVKRIECYELSTIAIPEYSAICRSLGLLFMKPAPEVGTKVKAKSRTATKTSRKATLGLKKTPSKKAVRKILSDAGILDMTLRELLAS